MKISIQTRGISERMLRVKENKMEFSMHIAQATRRELLWGELGKEKRHAEDSHFFMGYLLPLYLRYHTHTHTHRDSAH